MHRPIPRCVQDMHRRLWRRSVISQLRNHPDRERCPQSLTQPQAGRGRSLYMACGQLAGILAPPGALSRVLPQKPNPHEDAAEVGRVAAAKRRPAEPGEVEPVAAAEDPVRAR